MEDAMCYSRDSDTRRRKRQEAEATEAQRNREGVIKTLLSDAEKKAAEAKTDEALVKETTVSK